MFSYLQKLIRETLVRNMRIKMDSDINISYFSAASEPFYFRNASINVTESSMLFLIYPRFWKPFSYRQQSLEDEPIRNHRTQLVQKLKKTPFQKFTCSKYSLFFRWKKSINVKGVLIATWENRIYSSIGFMCYE